MGKHARLVGQCLMRYLVVISLVLASGALLISLLPIVGYAPWEETEKEPGLLHRQFILSEDIDSQRDVRSILRAYQVRHPEMQIGYGDRWMSTAGPMVETTFALRPELISDCRSPTLGDYQQALKEYDPQFPKKVGLNFSRDLKGELSNRIHLVSRLLNGESVDYKSTGLKECHLDVLKDLFKSPYAQARLLALPLQLRSIGAIEAREALDRTIENYVLGFRWEYPSGTTPEGLELLPHSLETNFYGINDIIGR